MPMQNLFVKQNLKNHFSSHALPQFADKLSKHATHENKQLGDLEDGTEVLVAGMIGRPLPMSSFIARGEKERKRGFRLRRMAWEREFWWRSRAEGVAVKRICGAVAAGNSNRARPWGERPKGCSRLDEVAFAVAVSSRRWR